jgi:hypothetical protein
MSNDQFTVTPCQTDRLSIVVDPDDDPLELDDESWGIAMLGNDWGNEMIEIYVANRDLLPNSSPFDWLFVVSGPIIDGSDDLGDGSSITADPWTINDDLPDGIEFECAVWD